MVTKTIIDDQKDIGKPTLTCSLCGHTGTDVEVQEYEFMGEVRRRPECTDLTACWQRYDRLFKEATQ